MSDPSARYQADPHPLSEHRTPSEILLDEAGPIGKPDLDDLSKSIPPGSVPEGSLNRPQKRRTL